MATNESFNRDNPAIDPTSRLGAPERYSLSEYDQVETFQGFPVESIRDKNSFERDIERLAAWPSQHFRIQFSWNNPDSRWYFRMTHLNSGDLMFHSPAVLDRPYEYRNLLMVMFSCPSDETSIVDHRSLGQTVYMDFYPGPDSPAFPFDLDEDN